MSNFVSTPDAGLDKAMLQKSRGESREKLSPVEATFACSDVFSSMAIACG